MNVRSWLRTIFGTSGLSYLFLTLVVVCLYGKTVQFDFISYDDDYHVYNNLSVRTLSTQTTWEILTGQTRLVPGMETLDPVNRIYIPLSFLSFQWQYALNGPNPGAFHAVNIILFILLVLSVFRLLHFWLQDKTASLLCALVFAIHPLNTEPAVWITGRRDLLCALFIVQGLLAYGRTTRIFFQSSGWLALLCFTLAALAKPSGSIIIAALVVYDLCFKPRPMWFKLMLEKIPFLLLILPSLLLSVPGYGLEGNRFYSPLRLLFVAGTPFYNLGQFFLPFSLSGFYPYPAALQWTLVQQATMAAGAFMLWVFCAASKKEARLRLFGIVFFFTTLLPYNLRAAFFTDGGFTSNRYLLMPMLGLLVLIGCAIKNSQNLKGLSHNIIKVIFVATTVAFGLLAFQRANAWQNTEAFALDIVKKFPTAANAQEELGRIYMRRGERERAAQHFKAAILANPTRARLIWLYELLGLDQSLVELYRQEIASSAGSTDSAASCRLRKKLGMVFFRLKQFDQAESYLKEAMACDDKHEALYNLIAGAQFYQNKTSDAILSWKNSIAINPQSSEAYNNLGAAFMSLGLKNEAQEYFKKVLTLNPNHAVALKNLEKLQRRKIEDEAVTDVPL